MSRPRLDPEAVPTPTRILDAAEAAFAREGFASTRLADVSGAAGIRRPSLLYHFPSKERLYAAVVERAFARLGEALQAGMSHGDTFEARFEATVLAYLTFLREDAHFAPLLLREMLDGRGPGRRLVLSGVVPLLDAVEAFVSTSGARLRPGVPLRAAVLQTATGALVRAAAGPLELPLWGPGSDPAPRLARLLLLEDS